MEEGITSNLKWILKNAYKEIELQHVDLLEVKNIIKESFKDKKESVSN